MASARGRPVLIGCRGVVNSFCARTGSLVRGVGFWTAILLPVLYLPMLLLNHPWAIDVANIVKVVALHMASLVVGRGHGGVDHE